MVTLASRPFNAALQEGYPRYGGSGPVTIQSNTGPRNTPERPGTPGEVQTHRALPSRRRRGQRLSERRGALRFETTRQPCLTA